MEKLCTPRQADCTINHPKKQPTKADASFKAEQDKNRGMKHWRTPPESVFCKPSQPVPVRLMKRDLLFIAEQTLPLLDEKRAEMVARIFH